MNFSRLLSTRAFVFYHTRISHLRQYLWKQAFIILIIISNKQFCLFTYLLDLIYLQRATISVIWIRFCFQVWYVAYRASRRIEKSNIWYIIHLWLPSATQVLANLIENLKVQSNFIKSKVQIYMIWDATYACVSNCVGCFSKFKWQLGHSDPVKRAYLFCKFYLKRRI